MNLYGRALRELARGLAREDLPIGDAAELPPTFFQLLQFSNIALLIDSGPGTSRKAGGAERWGEVLASRSPYTLAFQDLECGPYFCKISNDHTTIQRCAPRGSTSVRARSAQTRRTRSPQGRARSLLHRPALSESASAVSATPLGPESHPLGPPQSRTLR